MAAVYLLLIALGFGLGLIFSRGWQGMYSDDVLGDGPMVPPIYTLPPVRYLMISHSRTSADVVLSPAGSLETRHT